MILDGIRVIDFTQYWAGSSVTRLLRSYGAEIIKVESRKRHDPTRTLAPHMDGKRGINRGAAFHEFNRGKLSVTLDLSKPDAVSIVKRLVKISDVVAENFVPGVMTRLGIDYQALKTVRDNIVMLSVSGYGQTGPDRGNVMFADPALAVSGLGNLTGFPGSPPVWVGMPFVDLVAGLHGAFAVISALEHRANTGQGQYIDLSMCETALCFIPEANMDFSMNKHQRQRMGNRDEIMAPHGYYRCQGDDKWVAIAIATDEEWQAFCTASGRPELTKDSRFSDTFRRQQNQDDLDKFVENWTKTYSHYEVTRILQEVGVAAAPVLDIEEIIKDSHTVERNMFLEVEHPEVGKRLWIGLPFKMHGVDINSGYAPMLGEHNEYVFRDILGMSQDEIADHIEKQVIY